MSWGFFDRVRDTTTTAGTGDITVSGTPPAGFRTFSAVYVVGQRVPYVIAGQTPGEWEVGRGTYTAANTIARTEVTSSSNADAIVNFTAGPKDVWVDITAFFVNDVDTHGQALARATFQCLM